jgi:hypothetical protein
MYAYYVWRCTMKKNTKHSDQTKIQISEKMKKAWAAVQSSSGEDTPRQVSPTVIDERAVVAWIGELDDNDFLDFTKEHVITRFKKIKK